MSTQKNGWNYLIYFLLASFWGGSYTAIKFAVLQAPPFFSAMLRVGIAQICLVLFMLVGRTSIRLPKNMYWKIWLIGLFPLGIPFAFLFWGERYISPGLAGILCATMPIWALILSLIFTRSSTNFSINKLLGLLIGLLGVCIIFWPMLNFKGYEKEIIGSIATLFMALSYAIGALLNQRVLGKQIPFFANIFHQNLSSFIFLLALSACFESWPSKELLFSSSQVWIASIYLGLFSTAIAWLIYFHLIREWGAIRAASVTYVAPILAILWDYVFFHNYPRTSEILGVMIILVGVILIQISKKQIPLTNNHDQNIANIKIVGSD